MTAETGRPQERRRWQWVIVIIAAVGTLQLLYLNFVEADRLFVHEREIGRLEREVEAMRSERNALAAVADHARDEAYREQLARKQGFIYPDELRVITQRP